MREPDSTDLTFPEVCLGLATAAAAYFAPPLLVLTLPALGLAMAQRVQPETLPAIGRQLLTAPGQARALLDTVRRQGSHARPDAGRAQLTQGDEPALAPTTRQRGRQQAQGAPDPLVRTLEEPPHRLIIGHTRGGKTTLIHSMATSWAAGGARVLVADPDAAPGQWPGCEVRGHGDDIASIAPLLATVATEVATRRKQRAAGQRRFEPLHFIIDEAQDVVPELPEALALVEDVARRGGKINVRLTLGVQDKQVGTLGLEGKSHLLRNFATADVLKDRSGRRVAVLRDAVTGERVTYPIPALPDPESFITSPALAPVASSATGTTQLIQRAEAPAEAAVRPATDLLAAMLAESVPAHQDAEGTVINPVPGNRSNGDGAGHSSVIVEGGNGVPVTVNATLIAPAPATKDKVARTAYERALVEVYRALGAEGMTFAKAYAQHKGTKEIVFTAWQEGKAKKGEQR